MKLNNYIRPPAGILILLILISTAFAQSTSFNYQGNLTDDSLPANGSYDFEFALFDSLEGGTQVGSTVARPGVVVTEGNFAVTLDFGSEFPGAARHLEIRVAPSAAAGSGSVGAFTILAPRQPILSVPYAMKSASADTATTALNADQLGGVTASEYVLTTDPRMTDARPPTPGSGDYIQNTTTQQGSSNFNISGTGKADIIDAATQYNIAGNRALIISMFSKNAFVGLYAGSDNVSGSSNSFFGWRAGSSNTDGNNNSFLGAGAGRSNTTGGSNTFVGREAGANNSTGSWNSIFGAQSGMSNTIGNSNSFFGYWAGIANTTGTNNSFFGSTAGFNNRSGSRNSYFGVGAGYGDNIATGDDNSFFGYQAGANNTSGQENSFFGNRTGWQNIDGVKNSFFGKDAGLRNTIGNENTFLGWGAGSLNDIGYRNTFIGVNAGKSNEGGRHNTMIGYGADTSGILAQLEYATAIGADARVSSSNTVQLGRANGSDKVLIPGNLEILGTLVNGLPAGDGNYIQNSTSQQVSSDFNISGTGTANTFIATTQYNIGTDRVLSIGGINNVFVGVNAGTNSVGGENSFFGSKAGFNNTTGVSNSFFGRSAGEQNTTGGGNSFFGRSAGEQNTTGGSNSFFGLSAGLVNTTGDRNSFFGRAAGMDNTSGFDNSFFGFGAGGSNTIASDNSFFGSNAGLSNTTGVDNSFLGYASGQMNTTGNNNSFFGSFAGSSNTGGTRNSYFGKSAGLNATGSDNSLFGHLSGSGLTSGFGNAFFGVNSGNSTSTGIRNTFIGPSAGNANTTGNYNTALGRDANVGAGDLSYATAIGSGTVVTSSNTLQLGRNGLDYVRIGKLGAAGSTSLCQNASKEIAACSSSIRYKSNIENFSLGSKTVRSLRPVTFNWKGSGALDLGLVAEEVAEIEPLLVTYNKNGTAEGVKYDRIGVVLLNVVKEQEAKIERQNQVISSLQSELAALKALVCADNGEAEVCRDQ